MTERERAAMLKRLGGDGAAEDGTDVGSVGARRVSAWLSGRSSPTASGVSGRLFVVVGCLGVLLVWAALQFGFARWKAQYDELARFGRTEVAPAIDPLAAKTPPTIEPANWKQAVADTHTMLIALTSASALDKPQMIALRDDVRARVARAAPATALKELADLWTDLEDRAGPLISSVGTPVNPNSRHAARIPRPPRPALLPPRPAKPKPSARPNL